MPVEDVAIRVTRALSRAESLFGAPADLGGAAAANGSAHAAHAGRSITSHAADLSGAAVVAHGNAVTATTEGLEHIADADTDLVRQLEQAAENHASSLSTATRLRITASEVPAALGPALGTAAGELTALKALRNRVGRMQELVARESAESARLAGDIRDLGYRG